MRSFILAALAAGQLAMGAQPALAAGRLPGDPAQLGAFGGVQVRVPLQFDEEIWFSTYKVHSRKAGSFRNGRCFIAGFNACIDAVEVPILIEGSWIAQPAWAGIL